MKKRLMVSVLVAGSALLSGVAAAQEVGKVLSSTPVLKRVTEPRSVCTTGSDGRQSCRTESVTEDRNIGYKVVYEYQGKQHTVQLPFQPGATIPLEVTPAVQGASAGSVGVAVPSYSSESEGVERYARAPEYVDRYDRYERAPVYGERAYYPDRSNYRDYDRSYYRDYDRSNYRDYDRSYYRDYYNPIYPVLGLTLGYAAGYYGHGWRGGFGHGHRHGGHPGHGHRGR